MEESNLSEKRKEEIRKEAKKIIDNFSSALEKVKFSKKDDKKELGGFREEGAGVKSDANFRRIMFENAPQKNKDSLIAEKKSW